MAARGTERSGGDQERSLDGKARGATLIEHDGAVMTTGSGLGQGRGGERERGTEVREARDKTPWQGSGPKVTKAPPREAGHDAQQRLPGWPRMTAVCPDGGGDTARDMAKPRKPSA